MRLTTEDGEHVVIRGEIGCSDANFSMTKWEAMRVACSMCLRALLRSKPGAITVSRTESGRLKIDWKDEPNARQKP